MAPSPRNVRRYLRSLYVKGLNRWLVPFLEPRVLQQETKLGFWFYSCLAHHASYAKGWAPTSGAYYEFGVAGGESILRYIQALQRFCADFKADAGRYSIVGFDSFRGLPDKRSERDDTVAWRQGQFSYSAQQVREKIRQSGFDLGKVTLVEGYFEEVLTEELRHRLKEQPPAIVSMDCDYYSSTKTVLEWLRPLLVSGTFFYFDDVWAFHGNPNYGELAAIREFNQKGDGYLTPFPLFGLESKSYIYSNKDFEFKEFQDGSSPGHVSPTTP